MSILGFIVRPYLGFSKNHDGADDNFRDISAFGQALYT
jgi:hypothetical protein